MKQEDPFRSMTRFGGKHLWVFDTSTPNDLKTHRTKPNIICFGVSLRCFEGGKFDGRRSDPRLEMDLTPPIFVESRENSKKDSYVKTWIPWNLYLVTWWFFEGVSKWSKPPATIWHIIPLSRLWLGYHWFPTFQSTVSNMFVCRFKTGNKKGVSYFSFFFSAQ